MHYKIIWNRVVLAWLILLNILAWSTIMLSVAYADAVNWREIIVHHTATPEYANGKRVIFNAAECAKIHKQRLGTDGSYCGYHYIIHRDGLVELATPLDHRGAHTRGKNFTAIGITFELDGRIETPTPEAVLAYHRLINELQIQLKRELPVSGHRDHRPTLCPTDAVWEAVG